MTLERIVDLLMSRAKLGTWDGRILTPYFKMCRWIWSGGATIIFTRDVGYHSSGWWKNPDYERCYHLSLSFFDQSTLEPAPRDLKLTRQIISQVYGRNRKLLWCEPPYSPDGKRNQVWHYRLFCDTGWNPIKPRGEVYGRELTEAGWKSFSDVRAEWEQEERFIMEQFPVDSAPPRMP